MGGGQYNFSRGNGGQQASNGDPYEATIHDDCNNAKLGRLFRRLCSWRGRSTYADQVAWQCQSQLAAGPDSRATAGPADLRQIRGRGRQIPAIGLHCE